jgi:phosphoserine aminotransferase
LENKAGFINTGTWSSKAIKEAKLIGEVLEIASSKDSNFNYIPKRYNTPADLDYLHITTNNTIFGTQFKKIPETDVSLVADMSSDIFSRKFDYSRFDLFYAGAQKNMGPAGATLVIVKEDILGKVTRTIPSILDYSVHLKSGSMFNTPPVFSVYTSLLTLRWIEKQGGIKSIGDKNILKANYLYNEIDRNSLFTGFAEKNDRSEMNATFNLVEESLTETFDNLCLSVGISGLKGHRSVGGYRASIYNALPIESVEILIDCMKSLEQNN